MSAAPVTRPAAAAERPLQVLYVEDNRVNALLFEQIVLGEQRIALRLAESGAEAMTLVGDWTPEVLVIDSHLPDTTGKALLALLRTRPGLQQAPAYMCTADNQPDDRRQAQAAGFAGFWSKPVDATEVLGCLLALHAGRR